MTTRSFKAALLLCLATLPLTATAADPALDTQAREKGIPVTELRVFAEVMERIRAAYIDEVSDKDLLDILAYLGR